MANFSRVFGRHVYALPSPLTTPTFNLSAIPPVRSFSSSLLAASNSLPIPEVPEGTYARCVNMFWKTLRVSLPTEMSGYRADLTFTQHIGTENWAQCSGERILQNHFSFMNESNIVCLGKTWEEPILCLLPVPSYVGKCLRERASKSLVILVGSFFVLPERTRKFHTGKEHVSCKLHDCSDQCQDLQSYIVLQKWCNMYLPRYPVHLVPEPWTVYLSKKGTARGLFFMDGEAW